MKIDWKEVLVHSHSTWFDLQTAIKVGKDPELHKLRGGDDGDHYYGEDNFSCRDGLAMSVRNWLKAQESDGEINLFDDETREPNLTRMLACYDGTKSKEKISPRRLLHTLDCLVALPALLLNPDRRSGNWWKTTPDELADVGDWCKEMKERRFAYYGIDNTILYHPALLSILTGLYRQALMLEVLGMNRGLKEAVSREDLDSVLIAADGEAAWELAEAARPWLQPEMVTTRFPIASGEWKAFKNLHRSLYRLGFRRVFGTINQAWNLDGFYLNVNGVKTFLEAGGKDKLDKLAKKKIAE